jgi:hypothetical protein
MCVCVCGGACAVVRVQYLGDDPELALLGAGAHE